MEKMKVLLSVGLIFAAETVAFNGNSGNSARETVDYRLPRIATPLHYDIKLIPYIEASEFTFDGDFSVRIRIHGATRNVSLHAHELEINETATTLTSSDDRAIYKPARHDYGNRTSILVLNFDSELSPGNYTLSMKYIGVPSSQNVDGFYRTSYTNQEGKKVWLALTRFEPLAARQTFPCWDEPAYKATFNISVKHHSKYRALSNMPSRVQHWNADGTMWTHFETTPVMSTYIVAIVIFDFARVSNANMTVSVWCKAQLTSNVTFALRIAEESASRLATYTNISLNEIIPKMDHVAISYFLIDGMENLGLVIYKESDITYHEILDATGRRLEVANLVAHEVAHQWFGNLVTPSWWTHLWLSEGFATFFSSYILNQIFKDWRKMDLLVVENLHYALSKDIDMLNPIMLEVNSPTEIASLISHAIYEKASVILRMLHHVITDGVFRRGIIRYLSTHKFSTVTSDDLWTAMQTALDESDIPHNDYKIKEVMDTWIKQRNFPLVMVTRNYETGETIISQTCFCPKNDNETDVVHNGNKWWIPVTFATQTNPDFSNILPNLWLKPLDQNISLQTNPNDWIIVNLQQIGYYRVNYDPINWQKLANYLNSEEYTKIHVLNRAQIINDVYILMAAGKIDYSVFFNITNYLSREMDYVPWYPMFKILEKLSKYFLLLESEAFKMHLAKILDRLLEYVGYEENSNEDDLRKLLRLDAANWACMVGNTKCRRTATAKLDAHLTDPETHEILSWWKRWTYCNGLMAANMTTWSKMKDLYTREHSNMLLEFMTCSENTDIIIYYLNTTSKIIIDNSTRKNMQHLLVFNSIVKKHAQKSLVLDYILENLERIKPRLSSIKKVLENIISNVYSKEHLDKIEEFVRNNFNSIPENLAEIPHVIEIRHIYLKSFTANFTEQFTSD